MTAQHPDSVTPTAEDKAATIGRWRYTLDELHTMARERFGDDPREWAFQCPNCKDIATPADFLALNQNPDYTSRYSEPATGQECGQICIGRLIGACDRAAKGTDGRDHAKRGCDWSAGGLFRGPWIITFPDGKELPAFRLAPHRPRRPAPASTS